MEISAPDFRILALAPFGSPSAPTNRPEPIDVDLMTLDEALERIRPGLSIPVPKDIHPMGSVDLTISAMKDFKPEHIVRNTPGLREIGEALKYAEQASTSGASPDAMVREIRSRWPELKLDLELPASSESARAASAIDDVLSMVAMPSGPSSASGQKAVSGIKHQIESLLSSLLTLIYANDDFRRLEAAWRGLETLVKQGPVRSGHGIRLTICPVAPDNFADTLAQLPDALADEPLHLVLFDLEMDAAPVGIGRMEAALDFADQMLAPTACWVGPRFFHFETWSDLGKAGYLKHYLEDASFAKWRKLAEHPGAVWTTICLNRFLARFPYGPQNPTKGVAFDEPAPLWISPVWAVGALAAQSRTEYGWPSRFTDYASISLKDLPLMSREGGRPSAVEAEFSEDRILGFIDAGLTPLVGPIGQDTAFMPKETTLAGGSLKYQLFASQLLGFLFWCREAMGETIRQGDPAAILKQAFSLYWQKTGHMPPEDLDINAAEQGDALQIFVALTPTQSVLPSGQKLEFGFNW